MKIYWYAPFDNAAELDLVSELSTSTQHDFVVQSCSHRFQEPLGTKPVGRFSLIRNLPPPAGELGERRTALRQLFIVLQRSSRRRRVVRTGAFQIVHLHTFNLITDWIALKRLQRKASVVIQSVHDVRPQRARLPRRLETFLLGKGYRSCTALIVAHEQLRELLVGEFNVPANHIHVVPLPVRPLPGITPPRTRSGGETLTVLFFGTFRENKGILMLLSAIRLLQGHEDLRFVFAGRGEAYLEDAVKEAASSDTRIQHEIGYVTDQRRQDLLELSDLLVLPYEQFNSQSGVLTQDAYGSRRPVIATRVGALGQAVEQDRSGWLVEPGDAQALARQILQVLKMPEEYNECVARIEQIARTRAVRDVAKDIGDVYATVLLLKSGS